MSRTGTCPLCNTMGTNLTRYYKLVHYCEECYDNYRILLMLSNNGDRKAYNIIKKITDKLENLQPERKQHQAFTYAEEHWGL